MTMLETVMEQVRYARTERLAIDPSIGYALENDGTVFRQSLLRFGAEKTTLEHVQALVCANGIVQQVADAYRAKGEEESSASEWFAAIAHAFDMVGLSMMYVALELYDGIEIHDAFNDIMEGEEHGNDTNG